MFPLLKAVGTHGNGVNIVKVFNNAKMHYTAGFFPGVIPWTPTSATDAWTQTPISAWLASVHIIPVLRNDH